MSFFTAEILLPSAENVANASSAVEKLKFMLHSYQAMPIELYDYAKHLNPAEFDEISVGRREIRGRIWTSVCATGDRSNQSFNEIVEFAFQKNALLRYGMEVKFADENRLEMCPKGCADADLDELSAVKQVNIFLVFSCMCV